MTEKSQKRFPVPAKVIIALLLLCGALNIAARASSAFADFYTDNIFVYISTPFAFISSLLPFSLGELLIIIGVGIIVIGIPALIISMIVCKGKRKGILKFTAYFLSWIIVYIAVTETLNCFIQYQCTTFANKYYPEYVDKSYSLDELTDMVEFLIRSCNELSEQVPRGSDGLIILPEDLGERAGEHMRAISDDYPRLAGFYTRPKEIFFSRFMSKANLQGIYFPFTMESNYNRDMYTSRVPCTVCHEFSHTKGFILEDEAGFIAFVACYESGDPLFMYSGCMSALNYSYNRLARYITDEEKARIYSQLNERVFLDNKFISDEYRASLNKDKGIKTEKVAKASDKALNTNLKVNGVADGTLSYGRMVNLLLTYYYNVMPR